jgi:hypothetical protein
MAAVNPQQPAPVRPVFRVLAAFIAIVELLVFVGMMINHRPFWGTASAIAFSGLFFLLIAGRSR